MRNFQSTKKPKHFCLDFVIYKVECFSKLFNWLVYQFAVSLKRNLLEGRDSAHSLYQRGQPQTLVG